MKQTGIIITVAIVLFSCQHPASTHKVGLVKQDTIIAGWITSAYGALQGGPAIRTISYKEKVTTTDSITFTKSVELDTTCIVYAQQPLVDTATHRIKIDSLGNTVFKTVTFTIPGKYVKETGIPTH